MNINENNNISFVIKVEASDPLQRLEVLSQLGCEVEGPLFYNASWRVTTLYDPSRDDAYLIATADKEWVLKSFIRAFGPAALRLNYEYPSVTVRQVGRFVAGTVTEGNTCFV